MGSKSSLLLFHSGPVLADTGSPRVLRRGGQATVRALLSKKEGTTTFRLLSTSFDFFRLLSTTSRSSFGGPGPVCRARPADSTTANKIQGPGSGIVTPPQL